MLGQRTRNRSRVTVTSDSLDTPLIPLPSVCYARSANADLKISYVSDNAAAILGWPAATILAKPDFWRTHVHPDDVPRLIAAEKQSQANANPCLDYRLRQPDGSYRWLRDQMLTDPTAKAPSRAIIGLITDKARQIDRQGRLEALIERVGTQLSRADSVFRHARCFSYQHDPNGCFTSVSDNITAITGYSVEEWLRPSTEFLTDNPINRRARDLTRVMLETGSAQPACLVEIRHKNGSLVTLDILENPIFENGKIVGIAGLARDVTDHALTTKALQDQETRFRHVFEQAPIGMALVDTDGHPIHSNIQLQKMLGYSDEELMRMTFDQFTHPEDAVADRKLYDELVHGRRENYSLEKRYLTKDGKIVWGRLHVALVRNSDGDPQLAIGMVADITEQRTAETQAREATEKLERALIATIEALSNALEKRDPYTAGHQKRVAELAVAIGRKMGLADTMLRGIEVGGLIHDIGKIYVPAEILSRPGRLLEAEFAMVKTHCQVGHDIIKNVKMPWPVADMVLQHHERMDGSGYPMGLKGEAICLEARILAVADTIEAMATHRPYRPALGIDRAIEEISNRRGSVYDPRVVDACITVIREDGFSFTDREF